ncbi:hypothetical protein IAT38_004943 [Cryptococcus sp. DSM 104549]
MLKTRRKFGRRMGMAACGAVAAMAGVSAMVWGSVILIPFVGVVAIPCFAICLLVLVYAIPSIAYLHLAQTDKPPHITGAFLPFELSRNIHITLAILQLYYTAITASPRVIYYAWKYVVWDNWKGAMKARMKRWYAYWRGKKAGKEKRKGAATKRVHGKRIKGSLEEEEKSQVHGSGIFRDYAVFGVPYAVRTNGKNLTLDVYLPAKQHAVKDTVASIPPKPSTAQRAVRGHPPSPLNLKAHIDATDEPLSAATPWSAPPEYSQHDHPPPLLPSLHERPSMANDAAETSSAGSRQERNSIVGKAVVVFVPDVGMVSPMKPRKEMFNLVGAKLRDMGYVTVIPNLTLYPKGNIEDMVTDLRYVLSWVRREIRKYGGSPNRIFLCGHGQGGHLAMFTLTQEAVVRSRDARRRATEKKKRVVITSLNGMPMRRRQKVEVEQEEEPNGVASLRIYGGEVDIPRIRGVILLAPVSDIIKQVRHESTHWLEYLSPTRRAHGITQMACMQNSLGHLLFASRSILQPERMPSQIFIMHGDGDRVVPFESSVWLSELLHGLGVSTVFRPFKSMGHVDIVTSLMKGVKTEHTDQINFDCESCCIVLGVLVPSQRAHQIVKSGLSRTLCSSTDRQQIMQA